MPVDKQPQKKDKLTDAEKKKLKQANKVKARILFRGEGTSFFWFRMLNYFFLFLFETRRNTCNHSLSLTPPRAFDVVLFPTKTAGESESGQSGGEESQKRRQARRSEGVGIAESYQQIKNTFFRVSERVCL